MWYIKIIMCASDPVFGYRLFRLPVHDQRRDPLKCVCVVFVFLPMSFNSQTYLNAMWRYSTDKK
jgi:hypothetical protein